MKFHEALAEFEKGKAIMAKGYGIKINDHQGLYTFFSSCNVDDIACRFNADWEVLTSPATYSFPLMIEFAKKHGRSWRRKVWDDCYYSTKYHPKYKTMVMDSELEDIFHFTLEDIEACDWYEVLE